MGRFFRIEKKIFHLLTYSLCTLRSTQTIILERKVECSAKMSSETLRYNSPIKCLLTLKVTLLLSQYIFKMFVMKTSKEMLYPSQPLHKISHICWGHYKNKDQNA